jgi:hypothetical protein
VSLKSFCKQAILPKGRSCRKIKAGLASGLKMELDLQSQMQRYSGLDELEIAVHIKRYLSFCKSCVDIGANDGYYTLVFLRSAADQVVACEPGPVVERLVQNANNNGFAENNRLIIERRLIGSSSGQVSIQQVVQDLAGPILVKVDVDGVEMSVLDSASDSNRLKEINWIVETHSAELEKQCVQWFGDHGIKATIIKNAWWRTFLPEQRPLDQNRWLIAEPTSQSSVL